MPPAPAEKFAALLPFVQRALKTTQEGVARTLGCSRRTVTRWMDGGTPSREQLRSLARAVYPVDAALAARIALHSGDTVEGLGLVAPPTPKAPPTPLLVESVVCAAAEALNLPPGAARPAVFAAFRRAEALGLAGSDVVHALAGEAPKRGPARRAR